MSKPLNLDLLERVKVLEENIKWKKIEGLNVGNNANYTNEVLKNASEVWIKGQYDKDTANYVVLHLVNDGTSNYYQLKAYHWQGDFYFTISMNWLNGKITNNSANVVIREIMYR